MSFPEREQYRRQRTASEERARILLAVIIGVTVQSLELVIVIFLLLKVVEALQ
jgi:hypothetical protein